MWPTHEEAEVQPGLSPRTVAPCRAGRARAQPAWCYLTFLPSNYPQPSLKEIELSEASTAILRAATSSRDVPINGNRDKNPPLPSTHGNYPVNRVNNFRRLNIQFVFVGWGRNIREAQPRNTQSRHIPRCALWIASLSRLIFAGLKFIFDSRRTNISDFIYLIMRLVQYKFDNKVLKHSRHIYLKLKKKHQKKG